MRINKIKLIWFIRAIVCGDTKTPWISCRPRESAHILYTIFGRFWNFTRIDYGALSFNTAKKLAHFLFVLDSSR